MYSTSFATALGEFVLIWTDRGLRRVFLPGDDAAAVGQKLAALGAEPAEPDRATTSLADRIEDYADGLNVSFADVVLDLDPALPPFHRRCYEILLTVGWGETTTYGDIARTLGDVRLSRAVGQAMGANPAPLIIPCHRVLGAGGATGGFSAPGGATTKRLMLALEGVSPGAPPGQMQFVF